MLIDKYTTVELTAVETAITNETATDGISPSDVGDPIVANMNKINEIIDGTVKSVKYNFLLSDFLTNGATILGMPEDLGSNGHVVPISTYFYMETTDGNPINFTGLAGHGITWRLGSTTASGANQVSIAGFSWSSTYTSKTFLNQPVANGSANNTYDNTAAQFVVVPSGPPFAFSVDNDATITIVINYAYQTI